MRKTVVYAGVANLLQFRGQNVQMRNVGEFEISSIFSGAKKKLGNNDFKVENFLMNLEKSDSI